MLLTNPHNSIMIFIKSINCLLDTLRLQNRPTHITRTTDPARLHLVHASNINCTVLSDMIWDAKNSANLCVICGMSLFFGAILRSPAAIFIRVKSDRLHCSTLYKYGTVTKITVCGFLGQFCCQLEDTSE